MKSRLSARVSQFAFPALMVGLLVLVTACTETLTEQDHIKLSLEHEKKGEISAAIIELKNALQKNQNSPDSRMRLGELLLRVGDMPSAEKELRRAQQLGADQSKFQIPLGRALLSQQDFPAVLELLDASLAMSGTERVTVKLMRADALVGLRELAKARKIYNELLSQDKHNAGALIGVAQIDIASGNVKAAERNLSLALTLEPDNLTALFVDGSLKNQQRRFVESEQRFEHALKLLPSDRFTAQAVPARAGLAESLLGQEKTSAALEHIDALLVEIPDHPVPNYLKGYADYQAGKLVQASEALQKVLRYLPNHPPTLVLLGAVNYGRGNLEQAETYLTRAFTADGGNVGVRKLLAATRLQLNQPEEALSALTGESGLLASDAQILSLSGTARIASGDAVRGLAELQQSVKSDPENRELRLELAAGYLRTGNADDAIAVLVNTKSSRLNFRRESLMITAHAIKGQTSELEGVVEKLLKDNPNNPAAHNLAGLSYATAGQLEKAVIQFKRVLELDADSINAHINLGRLAFKAEDYPAAQEYFEKAVSASKDNAIAMTLLAYSLQRRGNESQAVEWFEKARSSDTKAIDARLALIRHYLPKRKQQLSLTIAQEAARVSPENPLVVNALGVAQMAASDNKGAARSFEKVTRLAPKSADAFHNLARTYLVLQKNDKARLALLESLRLDPNHEGASSTLAVMETRQGHYKKALAIARKQQKSHPEKISGYVLEGDIHMLNGEPKAAAESFAKAHNMQRSQTTVLKLFSAQRNAQIQGASTLATEWLDEHPDDNQVKMALATSYLEDGEHRSAEEMYESLIEDEPNAIGALNNLAWIYYLDGNKKSIELAERAHKLAPGVGAITDTLGWVLTEFGETKRGIKLLEQALEESPGTPDIQYHLAEALSRDGRKEDALKLVSEALSSKADFENRKKAQQLLTALQ